jgi:hypothetical protein
MIGATTVDEYRKHIEKDAALERRFQPVLVDEHVAYLTVLSEAGELLVTKPRKRAVTIRRLGKWPGLGGGHDARVQGFSRILMAPSRFFWNMS